MSKGLTNVLFLIFFLLTCSLGISQDVDNSRRMSPKLSSSISLGISEIKITYHSPQAKGRKIFGGVVPYDFIIDGKEYAWRAGSNEKTIIEFEHDVFINNKIVKAGKYGLVVLVSEKDWVFVLTKDLTWGAFQYTPDKDVIRIKVPVKEKHFQEWLSFRFTNPKSESVDIELHWTDKSASFTVSTDVSANIINKIKRKEKLDARDYRILANELIRKDPNNIDSARHYLEKALLYNSDLENSDLRRFELFTSRMNMADLLVLNGDKEKGEEIKMEALASADGFDLYYYGLNLLLVKNQKQESYKILKDNIRQNPLLWQAYLAMGEYYLVDGDREKVVENFKKAFDLSPENWKNYARYLYLQNKMYLDNK